MQRRAWVVVVVGLAACDAAVGEVGDAPGEDATDAADSRFDESDGDGTGDPLEVASVDDADAPADGDAAATDATDPTDTTDATDATDTADTTPRDFGPPVPEALAATLQALLDARFAAVEAAAVAIGVRLPDGAWWEGVRGEACHEPATRVVGGDRFRLGSITKTWVAAAVLQLVDEGRVDLDRPIGDYVPGFDLEAAVTVRRCLSHTTGIFDLTDDVFSIEADFSQPVDPREIVRQALAHAREFPAGESYQYSNTNYFLLGLLLQEVTGQPLAQVLRERLIDPLGLIDTFLEDAEPARTTFVCGNVYDLDMTDVLDMSWTWAAGAMVSSTGDLCRWAEALWRGDVLPPGLRDAMMAPTVLPDGRIVAYGLGTKIVTRGGRTVVGHNGQTLGFQSELYIDPASGLCVAVLANDFAAHPEAVGAPAWDALAPALDGP